MSETTSNAALERLLAIVYRSLPMYLVDVAQWVGAGQQPAAEAMQHIVADQTAAAQRLGELILQRQPRVEIPPYPIEFADTHFLSVEFLLKQVLQHQRSTVAGVEQCVGELAGDPRARELAEEILGSEKAHLEMLEELVQQPV